MQSKKIQNIFESTLDKHKSYFYTLIFLSIFVAYLPISPIIYMRIVFGPVINSDSVAYLLWLTSLLISALVLNAVLEWIRDRVLLAGTVSFITQLENKVYEMTFEKKQENWKDGNRSISNLRTIRSFMATPVAGAVMDVPFSLSLLLVIFFIHPLMGYFSLIGALAAFLIGIYIDRKVAPHAEEASQFQSEGRNKLQAYFRNVYASTSMGNLPTIYRDWDSSHKKFLLLQSKASRYQALGGSVTQVIMMVQGSMVLGVGTLLTLIGMMDFRMAGNLIIAKFIGALAIRPAMMVVMAWTQIIRVRESVSELKLFLKDYQEPTERISLPPPKGFLSVSQMSLVDPNSGAKLLENINFSIKPGNILVVLGQSGSGKSTLLKLLVGIEEPSQGSVRLDGANVASWNKMELNDHIGYLPQDLEIFGGSVVENITRFRTPKTQDLRKACEYINLSDISKSYENGISEQIDVDGNTLSGGKKQKIGIARALYGDPKYIIFDEPTSKLDNASEYKFIQSLKQIKQERKALIILATHNKNLLLLADYVLVIQQGKQISMDSKEKLIERIKASTAQKK
jgi:ATP-binding cassette subfamily C exporter for protease/lipase